LRIFSIRQKKERARVATLSIKEIKSGNWVVDQLKGPLNADVGHGLWEDIDGLKWTPDLRQKFKMSPNPGNPKS
jgi:hypothetical protein